HGFPSFTYRDLRAPVRRAPPAYSIPTGGAGLYPTTESCQEHLAAARRDARACGGPTPHPLMFSVSTAARSQFGPGGRLGKTPRAPRKRRTREHVIADLGVNFVERQALLCGYTVEKIVHDYGYDLLLFTFDAKGYVENGFVFLQVKATDSLQYSYEAAGHCV